MAEIPSEADQPELVELDPTEQQHVDARVQHYYGSDFDEAARLTTRSASGQIEFLRVQQLLAPYLTEHLDIADIGGATGVHAEWLAEAGHRVVLIDPVAAQVEQAAQHGGFEARVGDARALDLADDSVDLALLFGPLYHLAGRADRLHALREAVRVTRVGGHVAVAVITRWAAFTDSTSGLPEAAEAPDWVHHLIDTGEFLPGEHGFPGAHFHTAAELEGELAEAGLSEVTVTAIEGPTLGLELLTEADHEVIDAALVLVRATGHLPGARELSAHMMGIGRVG